MTPCRTGLRIWLAIFAALIAILLAGSTQAFACTIFAGSVTMTRADGRLTIVATGVPFSNGCSNVNGACGTSRLANDTYDITFVQAPVFDQTTLPFHHECMIQNSQNQSATMTVVDGNGSAPVVLPPGAEPGDQSTICIASESTIAGNEDSIIIL